MFFKYDVIILVASGIGNTLEALYALEYCLNMQVKAGMVIDKVNQAFVNYIKECYGEEVILKDQSGLSCKYLIHGFTFEDEINISFDHYFYVDAGYISTKNLSETEQFLSIVQALFPGEYYSKTLDYLKGNFSDKVKKLGIEEKYVLYPGGSPTNSARRWPHYYELIHKLGEENVIVIGGKEDLDFSYAYVFPAWFSKLFPQKVLNQIFIWKFLKKLGLMKKYAHLKGMEQQSYAYFNVFDWYELVEIFRKCKGFIGNDGGLMHLAAASGAKGVTVFGPSSVNKNKPFNPDMREKYLNYPCQPCQFGAGGINLTKYYINCPYQVKCLSNINIDTIVNSLK